MPTIAVETTVEVELTIYQLADFILDLNSEQQALLLSELAARADFSVPMQLEYVRQDDQLTTEGRSLMRLIGDYSEAI
jgi:hypothetical protein